MDELSSKLASLLRADFLPKAEEKRFLPLLQQHNTDWWKRTVAAVVLGLATVCLWWLVGVGIILSWVGTAIVALAHISLVTLSYVGSVLSTLWHAGTKPKTPQPTPIVETPANWDDVSQVPQDTEEFSNVKAEFDGQCSVWAHAYPFTLALEAVYRINSPVLERTFREAHTNMHSKKPQIRLLYHGTAYASVKAICRGGFRLPSISGMFGKGIYFACSPLKSWQYSNRKTSEYMLACDVALDNAKKICEARLTFDPAVDLRQPWLGRIVGVKGFDSLVAPCRQDGGAVNVPEYVIFHPDRALPRYVLEVRETRHTRQSL